MHKIIYTALPIAAALMLSHTAPAQAQIPLQSTTPSVQLFSLDGPPRAITYTAPTPRNPYQYSGSTLSLSQGVNSAANTAKDAAANIDVAPPADGWKWKGRVTFGASLQTGNTEEEAINADAFLQTSRKVAGYTKHRASLDLEFNLEDNNDERTEDNRSLEAAYDYFFNKKLFLNNVIELEQDDIDQIDLRTTAAMGLGYQFYERDDLNLQVVIGPSYFREEFESGDTDSSIAFREATKYDQKFWDDLIAVFHEHEIVVPGDATDEYVLESETGIRIPLRKGLIATAQIDYDVDSDPAPGVEKEDTIYALKLGYEWP